MLQIDYGDFDGDKHSGGFLKNIILQYIPLQLYKQHKPKTWERDLLACYEKLEGFNSNKCKVNFLKVCEKSPTYGYTLFLVKQSHIAKAPKTLFLGVNGNGVSLFRTDDKTAITPVEALSFKALSGWASNHEHVSLTVGKTKLNFNTSQGADICSLLKQYAFLIVARKDDEPKKKKK